MAAVLLADPGYPAIGQRRSTRRTAPARLSDSLLCLLAVRTFLTVFFKGVRSAERAELRVVPHELGALLAGRMLAVRSAGRV